MAGYAQELVSCCSTLAADVRKVRDLCQGQIPVTNAAQLARQLAIHLSELTRTVEDNESASADSNSTELPWTEVSEASTKIKQLIVGIAQLLATALPRSAPPTPSTPSSGHSPPFGQTSPSLVSRSSPMRGNMSAPTTPSASPLPPFETQFLLTPPASPANFTPPNPFPQSQSPSSSRQESESGEPRSDFEPVLRKVGTLNTALAGRIKMLHEIIKPLISSRPSSPALSTPTVSTSTSSSLLEFSVSGSQESHPTSTQSDTLPSHQGTIPSTQSEHHSRTPALTINTDTTTRLLGKSHSSSRGQPSSAPSAPSPLASSSGATVSKADSSKYSLRRSTNSRQSQSSSLASSQSAASNIDLTASAELGKRIKDSLYELADTYKRGEREQVDEIMNQLIDLCKQLVSLGSDYDLDLKRVIRGALKRVDQCITSDESADALQQALKDLHRTTREIQSRFRNLSSGRSPASTSTSLSATSSPVPSEKGRRPSARMPAVRSLSSLATSSFPTRRRATIASSGLADGLKEVNKLVGENTNRDPSELLTLECELGKGAFGAVWKAMGKTGAVYAVKMVPIHHKTLQTTIKIVMEYCDAGSVQDWLIRSENGLAEQVVAAICAQVLAGLKYLHSLQMIHRDIKSGNLLLNSRGEVKISDFGTTAEASVRRTTVIGSSFWMAPETLDQRGYDNKADIWSLGITLIEMAEKDPPYFTLPPLHVAQAILHDPPPTLAHPERFTATFSAFLLCCLKKVPSERQTCSVLEEHEWIRSSSKYSLIQLVSSASVSADRSRHNLGISSESSFGSTSDRDDEISSLPPINFGQVAERLVSVRPPVAVENRMSKSHPERRTNRQGEMAGWASPIGSGTFNYLPIMTPALIHILISDSSHPSAIKQLPNDESDSIPTAPPSNSPITLAIPRGRDIHTSSSISIASDGKRRSD